MLLNDLQPCLKGAAVMAQPALKEYGVLLRQLISAPSDVYAELYLSTLHAFAELCQSMPSDANPQAYGFIDQQLRILIAALKLRRGDMLPSNSDSESIAEQEPLWTYALFSAGLLWQLSHIQQHYSVDLYKHKGEKLGSWHPVAGSLSEENTYYQLLQKPPAFALEQTQFQILMAGKIMPTVGLRWLAEHQPIFKIWWEVITDQAQPDNILWSLLDTAVQHMNLATKKSQPDPVDSSAQNNTTLANNGGQIIQQTHISSMAADQVLDALNSWLTTQLNHNPPTPLFLRIPQGLFVSLEALALFVENNLACISLEALLDQLENILLHNIIPKERSKEESEEREEGEEPKETENTEGEENLKKRIFFHYRSIHFEQRQVLKGIIIPETYLHSALQSIPLQKNFIPNISF
jgi:hypothetical protein